MAYSPESTPASVVTGVQVLAKLPLLQRALDRAQGLATGGFVSGYRGSPLGGLDKALWALHKDFAQEGLVFQPGLNEDLAATAVWGTQQVNLYPDAVVDGVFAMWYGKGPGVDRSGDVFKHANAAGTARLGGVLALAGDDHTCKSSTLPHQSEYAFVDASIPVLNPAGLHDLIPFGLMGWALSRYSGLWVGMKTIAETADSSGLVDFSLPAVLPVAPVDFLMPHGGPHIRWPDAPLDQEARLHQVKLPAVLAFARANHLNHPVFGRPRARLGIVATGKSFLDVRQVLHDMGLSDKHAEEMGLALFKVGLSWPLEPDSLKAFAATVDALLVVEEKRPLVEDQIKSLLYGVPADARPAVLGKSDRQGAPLFSPLGEVAPARIAEVLSNLFNGMGFDVPSPYGTATRPTPVPARVPTFCAGCPHNSSTVLPKGARATGGIGCHYMATWMDRGTETFSQMGGEGVAWVGQAPFTQTPHVFANLGDGTYQHSGLLAIRASVAAGVNITYKILHNDAVAMTGGQPVDGGLSVAQLTRQLAAEGVAPIVVVAEDPARHTPDSGLAAGVAVRPRADLNAVQQELRLLPGVSALVFDQTCATEKRRRRKRGLKATPDVQVLINPSVCEGCGDCSVQSHCVAVVPLETPLGRKRAVDPSACNTDLSCLKGFCPSFVTVKGAARRAPSVDDSAWPTVPDAPVHGLDGVFSLLVTGVGGTGVVTLSALLAEAARADGLQVKTLDMTGLAQKGGAVLAHVRIAPMGAPLFAPRVPQGAADLLIGVDSLTAAGADALARLKPGHSRVLLNTHTAPTSAFLSDPDADVPVDAAVAALEQAVGFDRLTAFGAAQVAGALLGDGLAVNLFLLGFALQKGWLPVSAQGLEAAVRRNGAAVDFNLKALLWGRRAAVDLPAVAAAAAGASPFPVAEAEEDLHAVVARRAAHLTAYQNAAYARTYTGLVAKVRAAEHAACGDTHDALTRAVALSAFKLMAYKDEYEVARLHTDAAFAGLVARGFEEGAVLTHHFAPPLWAKIDPATGRPQKRAFGPWVRPLLRLLARGKFLRGTALDPFGYSAERRVERALVPAYFANVDFLLASLTPATADRCVEIAGLPQKIRGFGPVKEVALAKVQAAQMRLLAELSQSKTRP